MAVLIISIYTGLIFAQRCIKGCCCCWCVLLLLLVMLLLPLLLGLVGFLLFL